METNFAASFPAGDNLIDSFAPGIILPEKNAPAQNKIFILNISEVT